MHFQKSTVAGEACEDISTRRSASGEMTMTDNMARRRPRECCESMGMRSEESDCCSSETRLLGNGLGWQQSRRRVGDTMQCR